MKVLQECLLVPHFVGIVSLLGGFLAKMAAPTKRVVPAMLHGAAAMLLTGLGLYAVDDNGLHHAADGEGAAKLGTLVVIAGLIWIPVFWH